MSRSLDSGLASTLVAVDVESFEGLLATEVGALHAQVQLFAIAPCHLMMAGNDANWVKGTLAIDVLVVWRFQETEDVEESQQHGAFDFAATTQPVREQLTAVIIDTYNPPQRTEFLTLGYPVRRAVSWRVTTRV